MRMGVFHFGLISVAALVAGPACASTVPAAHPVQLAQNEQADETTTDVPDEAAPDTQTDEQSGTDQQGDDQGASDAPDEGSTADAPDDKNDDGDSSPNL